jgi:hypothetical protein
LATPDKTAPLSLLIVRNHFHFYGSALIGCTACSRKCRLWILLMKNGLCKCRFPDSRFRWFFGLLPKEPENTPVAEISILMMPIFFTTTSIEK